MTESRREGHTPGPWGWFGDTKHGNFYLATIHSGRRFVMGFRRCGMRGAQPSFQIDKRMIDGKDLAIYEVCPEATTADDPRVYRQDIIGFRSADAKLIAAAPDMAAHIDGQALLIDALIERLSEAELIDDMDRVEFNKWSQDHQKVLAKIEGRS